VIHRARAGFAALLALTLLGCPAEELPDPEPTPAEGPPWSLAERFDEGPGPAGEDLLATWDWAPPDVPLDSVVVSTLECGLLEGPSAQYWGLTEDGWQAGTWAEHDFFDLFDEEGNPLMAGAPQPGFVPCMRQSENRYVQWAADGHLLFYNADWTHDLDPSEAQGLWLGTVFPEWDVSQECLDGIASLGLEIPVPVAVRVYGVVLP
jgi:hypothetical protein